MKPIYLTTDTHFNHDKLWEVFADRPQDFEQKIIRGLQELPEDCNLIHLGDLSMGDRDLGQEKWNEGTSHIKNKILLLGNHDKSSNWFYERGWSFICNQFLLELFGKTILFSHEPQSHLDFPHTDINIHGHTHGNTHRDAEISDLYELGYHVELALEHNHYKPFLLNEKLLAKVEPNHIKAGGSDE